MMMEIVTMEMDAIALVKLRRTSVVCMGMLNRRAFARMMGRLGLS